MTYKEIKKSFSRKGFEYSLLKREGDLAIYSQFSGKNLELDNFAKGEYLFRLTDNSKINLIRKISFY